MTAIPALFVSHGAPTQVVEPGPAREFLVGLREPVERPRAILCATAHWTTEAPRLGAAAVPETIHDFSGFPEALYRLRYPAPGDPDLAERATGLLREAGLPTDLDRERGLDHGTWPPLLVAWPEADIPVVQLSVQPARDVAHHLAVGRALAPLREDGVLVLGSG
jgi:4,5-DOPA dioxygenase extradiol